MGAGPGREHLNRRADTGRGGLPDMEGTPPKRRPRIGIGFRMPPGDQQEEE